MSLPNFRIFAIMHSSWFYVYRNEYTSWNYKSSNFLHTNYKIHMNTEEDTRDHFLDFINGKDDDKSSKQFEPDFEILARIQVYEVYTPKRPEVVEKIHPYVQIANEKRSKCGEYADQLISQRNRCSTYSEIMAEEERKIHQKLGVGVKFMKKLAEKTPTQKVIHQLLGINGPKRPRRSTRRQAEQSSDEEEARPKRSRKAGPPYMPNVVTLSQINSKASSKAVNRDKKKQKRHAGSRSRSKHDRIEKARRKLDESSPERSPEREKSEEHYPIEIENQASKRGSFSNKLPPIDEGQNISKYLLQSPELNVQAPPQQQSVSNFEDAAHKGTHEEMPVSKYNVSGHSSQQNEIPEKNEESAFKPTYDEYAEKKKMLEQREEKLKKKEETLRLLQQRRKFEIKQKKEKIQLQMRFKDLEKKEREIKEREEQLNKNKHHDFSRKQSKTSKPAKVDKIRSKSPSFGSTSNSGDGSKNWKKELRQITHYDPHDRKYKIRDQSEIRESDFAQMNMEEAHSRKMGRKEEELDDQRFVQKTFKKKNH